MSSEKRGIRAEAKTLKRLGFRPTKASGAIGEKGDGRLSRVRVEERDLYIEIKTTEANSYSIKLEELRKARREARAAGCEAVFSVVFVNGNGDPRHDGGWVLRPEGDINLLEETND